MKERVFTVLRQLSDGAVHSSEGLAQKMGCSQAQLWEAIHTIQEELGLSLFSVRGQGYQLAQPVEWLDTATIRQDLSEAAAEVFTLALLDQTDSTNTQLMARASSGGLHGLVLAAEWQTAGRGRLGRRWHTGLGTSLSFSVLWRFELGMAQLAGLSLAVGVAIARTLRRLGAPISLKWPNDVLLDGRKLAGILIELSGDTLGPTAVVVGIGLNLEAPSSVDQPIAALSESGIILSRNRLLAALLNELQVVLDGFKQQGFSLYQQEWTALCAHHQLPVRLSFSHSPALEGVMYGVTEQGALLLETATGLRAFHAGEVSLRAIA